MLFGKVIIEKRIETIFEKARKKITVAMIGKVSSSRIATMDTLGISSDI
jgi:hypothetical protein